MSDGEVRPPYDATLLDDLLMVLAEHDNRMPWTIDDLSSNVGRTSVPRSAGAIESAVDRLVDGWGLLVWRDPLHLELTDAGRRAWHALQHRRVPEPVATEVVGAR
ncbi:hypothetical protein ACPCHT_37130 [Nucisporomicrobium flavum]|uniref:hypothetical protein n=1 Tax=Nucisporomicrobium flavum TaxID=2785915 RepID=UPI003C2D70AD